MTFIKLLIYFPFLLTLDILRSNSPFLPPLHFIFLFLTPFLFIPYTSRSIFYCTYENGSCQTYLNITCNRNNDISHMKKSHFLHLWCHLNSKYTCNSTPKECTCESNTKVLCSLHISNILHSSTWIPFSYKRNTNIFLSLELINKVVQKWLNPRKTCWSQGSKGIKCNLAKGNFFFRISTATPFRGMLCSICAYKNKHW
jgi:hypothetical protein